MTEYTTVTLWEVKRTQAAILFQTESGRPSETASRVWLPLSEIKSILKEQNPAGYLPTCQVEIPCWLAEAREL